jgi:hypothetical protein
MRPILLWTGRVAGTAGVCMMAVAAAARFAGSYWIGGFQAGTVLQAGIAAMLIGCLAYAAVVAEDMGA